MKKEGWSVLVPAFNAGEWLEECLDSIQNQTFFKDNDDWEIILAIDGCQKTLDKVNEIKDNYEQLRLYYLNENRGTYVTLNTILYKTIYNKSVTAGADDMMMPSLIEKVNVHMQENDVVMYYMQNFYPDGKQELSLKEVEGIEAVNWKVWEELGGYLDYRVGADSDFELRIKKTDFKVHIIRKPLYLRRIHPNSLTQNPETGYGSAYRKKVIAKLGEKIYRRPVKTNNYKLIV